jgi:hypothetical protein
MSIVPGSAAWRDAGVAPVDPHRPVNLGDDTDDLDDLDDAGGLGTVDRVDTVDTVGVVDPGAAPGRPSD